MKKLITNSFLIIGNTIGSGILALPLVTANYGFVPSVAILVFAWIVMTYASKVLLEACYWVKGDEHLVTILCKTLSKPAQLTVSLLYVFMMMGLLVAYISIGADLVQSVLPSGLPISMTHPIVVIGFTVLFGVVVFHKMHVLDHYNSVLVIGLLVIFALMLMTAMPHITVNNLVYQNFHGIYSLLPIAMLCFAYPVIVPSLRQYCGDDKKGLIWGIGIGGFISMLMYVLWQFAVMGTLPLSGPNALILSGQNVSSLNAALLSVTHSSILPLLLGGFAFLAVATSFMSVAKVLVDFFTDGLLVSGLKNHKRSAQALTLIPPVLVSLFIPGLFVYAITFSGTIMGILLLYLPAFVVWRGRYSKKLSLDYVCDGGKPLLTVLLVIGVAMVAIELIEKLWA